MIQAVLTSQVLQIVAPESKEMPCGPTGKSKLVVPTHVCSLVVVCNSFHVNACLEQLALDSNTQFSCVKNAQLQVITVIL